MAGLIYSKAKMTAWVRKAEAARASKVWYVVPKGSKITQGVRDHLTGKIKEKGELGIDKIIDYYILR
jgi:hypothetical protein